MASLPMGVWWLAGLVEVPFVGRTVCCKTLARRTVYTATLTNVSADGSVIVGTADFGDNPEGCEGLGRRAFRWTAAEGAQNLGTLWGNDSYAYSVSVDGSVVVGWAFTCRGWVEYARAFRWTVNSGVEALGNLGGCCNMAHGVSADGAVVVVWAAVPEQCAFRWTQAGGMEDLNITYAELLSNGSWLTSAYSISPDGRYIVGFGWNAPTERFEAFLLDTGFPLRGDVDRNGCVDDTDLLRVLFAFGGQGYRNEDLNWDSAIDDADLLIVLLNFGSGC